MRVLALDLSTSTGVSVFESDNLKDYKLIKSKVKGTYRSETYPNNYIDMAEDIALKVCAYIMTVNPDFVVIEETNKGRDRYSQKQLEFIHFAVAQAISLLDDKPRVRYIDTSLWRKILHMSLDSNQRKSNKLRNDDRNKKREEISKGIYRKFHDKIAKEVEGLGKRDSNKIIKGWDREINKMVGKEMGKIRSSIKIIDTKTLAVDYVNEHFGLNFKRSQNDIADSICLGYAFIKNGYRSTWK